MNKTENEYQDFLAPAPVNRQYKDRLFRMVFRNKKDLLELYNAMNGTDYRDEQESRSMWCFTMEQERDRTEPS